MNENDTSVIFLCVSKGSGGFGEISNIERHKDSLLTSRFPKQLCIFKHLERCVAGCYNYVISELLKRKSHSRRDICVKKDASGHWSAPLPTMATSASTVPAFGYSM